MSRYWSQRNTANRTHIWDDGSSASNLAERGPPGPRGLNGLNGIDGLDGAPGADGNADFMLLEAVQTGQNYYSITQMDYKISGSMDMLASHQVKRFSGHGRYGVGMLFKPGVYEVTITYRRNNSTNDYLRYGFDIDGCYGIWGDCGNPGSAADWGTGFHATNTTSRTFVVPNIRMFYILDQEGNDYYNDAVNTPQIVFKRIGHVEVSGTPSTLQDHENFQNTDTKTIAGGIYWNSNYGSPPASHHPSTHPSQGGTNEWAVIELAVETAQSAFGWIHRVKRFF